MSDKETLKVYDAQASKYAELTDSNTKNPDLIAFIGALKPGAHILDLGCGPGHMAAAMARVGFQVSATDASAEMVKLANAQPGVTAWQEAFEEMHTGASYDGVFANFSLLHAKRESVAQHVNDLVTMLTPGGVFHIALKTGAGEMRDTIGRRYSYFSEDELETILTGAGLKIIYRNHGKDLGLDGVMANWVSLQGRKPGDADA
ncbi:MAG: methyltransferase domain-containing protein [Pseudomonadota bacterium]